MDCPNRAPSFIVLSAYILTACQSPAVAPDAATGADGANDIDAAVVACSELMPAYLHTTPAGQSRTRGFEGRIAAFARQSRLVAAWSEIDAAGKTHVVVGDSPGDDSALGTSEAWVGDGDVHDFAVVRLDAEHAALVFDVQVGDFGAAGFSSTAWIARLTLGATPAAEAATILRANSSLYSSEDHGGAFLLLDFSPLTAVPMSFAELVNGSIVVGTVLSADLIADGFNWADMVQTGADYVVLARDANNRLHHRKLHPDGTAVTSWVTTATSFQFAGPQRIAGVGDSTVAVSDVSVAQGTSTTNLVVTTLDAATGATRRELVIPGTSGDFSTYNIVGNDTVATVVYDMSASSSDAIAISGQQIDATGHAVAPPTTFANMTAFQSGAATSGVFGGSVAVVDGKTHVLVPTHLRRVDPSGPLDDEFELHHALGCGSIP